MTRNDLLLWLRSIRARAYVRVVGAQREPSWMITEIGLPLVAMAAYVFLYRHLGADPIYEGMVIIGGAMIPFWLTVLWAMAAQFYWEKEMGNLDLYMAAPVSPIAVLIGMAVGGIFMAGLRAAAVLLFGLLMFQVRFTVTSWGWLALVSTLTMTAVFTMGMAASSIYFLVGRAGIKINLLAVEPVFLLGGFYFPVRQLGRTLAAVGSLIPLTLGLDAVRQLSLPGARALGLLSVPNEAAILAGMTVVFTVGAVWLMNYLESRGKSLGTMTLRWQ